MSRTQTAVALVLFMLPGVGWAQGTLIRSADIPREFKGRTPAGPCISDPQNRQGTARAEALRQDAPSRMATLGLLRDTHAQPVSSGLFDDEPGGASVGAAAVILSQPRP